jgi:hypothetical protein
VKGDFPPNSSIQIAKTIPVQVVVTDSEGTDYLVGDFSGGVVLSGLTLQDVATHTIIASFSMTSREWVLKGKNYRYLFIQVKPID